MEIEFKSFKIVQNICQKQLTVRKLDQKSRKHVENGVNIDQN